ncbi:PilZ domain-containing protein [Sphingomonas sp. BAUL-RG-20F-R05-02]|uniref:PilZ domain-containing protein n=1 Tax=Sphingomonas sp. BAUL-RG-20F-R05-02 TaxID=2914830 RepID=UPI001F58DABD|nr:MULTISPECIES: PilZ domain-containing protein [unclassified Sphingomonas]
MQRSNRTTGAVSTGRVARRHKLFEPVEIIVEHQPARAHILNISSTGALVHSAMPPATGASVKIKLLGTECAAHVVWSAASRFGVSFDTSIAERVLGAMLR